MDEPLEDPTVLADQLGISAEDQIDLAILEHFAIRAHLAELHADDGD